MNDIMILGQSHMADYFDSNSTASVLQKEIYHMSHIWLWDNQSTRNELIISIIIESISNTCIHLKPKN